MEYAELQADFYFVALPLLLTVTLTVLKKLRAHWAIGVGIFVVAALGGGFGWIIYQNPPFPGGAVLFFFLLPLGGIFLASLLPLVRRRPWSLLVFGPLVYLVGISLAASYWMRILTPPG